jgi:hypothetical protein
VRVGRKIEIAVGCDGGGKQINAGGVHLGGPFLLTLTIAE